MNYSDLRKLDEETLKKLTEGLGPSDECLCSLLSPPEEKKGFRQSIKKALASLGQGIPGKERQGRTRKKENPTGERGNVVEIPLSFTKGAKGIYTSKEAVKRGAACGKCGCDKENIVLKHSYANIRITSPDVSSICPCPSDCLPDKEKYQNNIKVTIERVSVTGHSSGVEDHGTREVPQTESLKTIDQSEYSVAETEI